VRDVRWLCEPPDAPLRAGVQVRHRAQPVPAEIERDGRDARVRFLDDDVIAAPGQAAVFYDGDAVLGGGWVQSAPASAATQAAPARADSAIVSSGPLG
jgi:tRNA-specific 2-thiouridylase